MVKFSDKGSGWYEQPGRHSRAKKYGTAGGTYAKRARHGGNKHLKKLTYKQLKAKKVTLPARGDADGDKVKNARDCRPFDPKKQDEQRDWEELQASRRAKEAHDKEVAELTKAMSKKQEPGVIIKHDGKEIGRAKNEAEAFHFIHGQVGYSVDHAMKYEGWTIEDAKKKPSSSDAIFKQEQWTEAEVNLIKNRLNSGKLKDYELPEEGAKLTPEQQKKGYDWLMDQWKTPRGVERKNNPFGYREQNVLENFKEIRLIGFYNIATYDQPKFVVPYYRVKAKDGGAFEYPGYMKEGRVQILG